ncbi:PaaI family thioesterase [Rhodospirillum sp. A1_3_36]|uniref:PaaI family thioesterase n=1 Tax=Rhodospirillum sp. A1_3_36 TaxID=3391666 RepID=UPI0039A6D243
MSRISLTEFSEILDAELPIAAMLGIRTEEIQGGHALLRMPYRPDLTRPGGTISGPAMMALADVAMYAVVLSLVGRVELAVTTNLSINFLRKPPSHDILAESHVLKEGKRLVVAEVELFSARQDGTRDLVAHVTGTYSVPPHAVTAG